MTLANGTTLGPYQILAPIGAGGMGEVYRARDARIGRDVAAKILPGAIASDPERLSRFEHEARAAGMLNHPNLLTIFDVGSADGIPFIVSELLEGETLRDRLEHSAIPQRKVIDYALQIANGLAAAHEKGLVHRDLKPENVFITSDGRVKILDFGLAKLNPQFAEKSDEKPMTEPGMVLGTVGYMSPEQVRGEPLDQRSDIFSFGAILYEMLAGGRAFRRESSIETLSAILKEDPPDLIEVNDSVSPALDRVVRRCLEKNRQQRFQSARDLAFHLESIPAGGSGVPRTATSAGDRAASPSRSSAAVSHDAATAFMSEPPGGHSAIRAASPAQIPLRSTAGRIAHPAPTAAHPKAMPARTAIPQKPVKRATSPWLIALAAVIMGIAGLVGGWVLSRRLTTSGVPYYHRITFQRGEVFSARFTPDGDTIVYSAAWNGGSPELYQMRRESPEARPFGISGADVASISKNGELALLLRRDRATGLGTLARVPLMGGTPRELLDNVQNADWAPDGENLVVVHRLGRTNRIEYPLGTTLYETPKQILAARISPDGGKIGFVEADRGAFNVAMIENGVMELVARGWSHGVSGIAWSSDGKRILFAGSESGNTPLALYSVEPGGKPSLVARMTGSLRLYDVAKNGRVLLSHNTWRSSMMATAIPPPQPQPPVMEPTAAPTAAPGQAGPAAALPVPVAVEPPPRDLAWLDWSIPADLSRDGRQVLFSETREGGGESSSIFLRKTDGTAPVRLGEGFADALSPDGKWVLAHRDRTKLFLLPAGTGEARELKALASADQGALFFPDGKHVLVGGAQPQHDYALHVIDVDSGASREVTPEGIAYPAYRPFAISPDGRFVAGMTKEKVVALYPVEGGGAVAVPEAQTDEVPIQFTPDGAGLLVYHPTGIPARVYRIDLHSGAREPWREFAAEDAAGVYRISPVLVSADGSMAVYSVLKSFSDLYVAEGLQ